MVTLHLFITHPEYVELKEHLRNNGYRVVWHSQEMIEVDEDELEYVKTILKDRSIGFSEE